MSTVMKFNDALEAVEELTPDEQTELIELVRQRLAEQGRRRAMEEVREGLAEFARGEAKPVNNIDDLIKEIES